eukprot:7758347-Karenia_brevis.AAC.1
MAPGGRLEQKGWTEQLDGEEVGPQKPDTRDTHACKNTGGPPLNLHAGLVFVLRGPTGQRSFGTSTTGCLKTTIQSG